MYTDHWFSFVIWAVLIYCEGRLVCGTFSDWDALYDYPSNAVQFTVQQHTIGKLMRVTTKNSTTTNLTFKNLHDLNKKNT